MCSTTLNFDQIVACTSKVGLKKTSQETPIKVCLYFVGRNSGGCSPYNGLYVGVSVCEGSAGRGRGGGGVGSAFFSLQVHESVEISLVEVYERVGKTVISVCQKAQKGKQMHFMAVKIRATFWFCDLFKF